jgi:hypothetical protein
VQLLLLTTILLYPIVSPRLKNSESATIPEEEIPMEIKIEGDKIHIILPINAALPPSKSGKSRIVATSNGIVATAAIYSGKPVKCGVNCFIDL